MNGELTPSDTVEVQLPNGASMYVTAKEIEGAGATKTSTAGYDFRNVIDALTGLSDVVRSAFASAAPHKTTVKIGIELSVKSGKLTALLVEGGAKGSLDITLEWQRPNTAAEG